MYIKFEKFFSSFKLMRTNDKSNSNTKTWQILYDTYFVCSGIEVRLNLSKEMLNQS